MSSPDEITSLADQLAAAQAERDENYQKYVRALADMDTYRRRVMKEREDDRRFAPLSLVKDLLPNLDNLRRAIDAAGQGVILDHGIGQHGDLVAWHVNRR